MCFWKSYICSNKVGCVRNKLQFHTVQQNPKIISLDAGLRLDGIPALELWDLIVLFLEACLRFQIEQGDQRKTQNQIQTKTTSKYGETRVIPTYRNGCKNSERILWMTEFLNAETHTQRSSHGLSLQPTRSADWVNTVFFLISLKTVIARFVKGQKLQGPRAEDALAELYLVLKILVT